MRDKTSWILWIFMLALVAASLAPMAWGDDDDHHRRGERGEHHDDDDDDDDDDHHRRGEKKGHHDDDDDDDHHGSWLGSLFSDDDEAVPAVTNAAYEEECGACHFAFQPALLPQASWERIMEGLKDHFGENATMEQPLHKEIAAYLRGNAAESSRAKDAQKILSSARGKAPLRITEIPYIAREHRKIPDRILARPAIGTLANCVACHRTAKNGNYDEDNVSIPR